MMSRFYTIIFNLIQVGLVHLEIFSLTAPDSLQFSNVGGKVVLPCLLSPSISAVDMEILWSRDERKIFYYREQKEVTQGIHSSYVGRTHIAKAEMTLGNVSLHLDNVHTMDEAVYTCEVVSKNWHDSKTVRLKIIALGSIPLMSLAGIQKNGILLYCDSKGWYPRPAIEWSDRKQTNLTGQAIYSEEVDNSGLYNVQSYLQVYEENKHELSCIIKQGEHELQSRISINEDFFPRVSAMTVVLGILLPLSVLAFMVMTFAALSFKNKVKAERQRAEAEYDEFSQRLAAERLRVQDEYKEQAQSLDARNIHKFAEDLTLDPETAHPYLQISEDRKQVKRGDKRQDLLDGPQRFDAWACVLSTQAFNSGRHYWEVDVGNNIDWILGVMKETALRKGTIDMTPSQGYWTLKQYEDQFTALDSIRTSLTLSIRPTAIGMYLDYEEGQFSIYNVNSRTLIYTFTENFSENVYPVFRTYDTCNLKLRLPVEIN
ncbi:butyrophilin subfamily 1 member A1-like isoform X1 [Polypterus senegalus]|uniref:butyrophilin subfamily 1 member A1-like isoform X1 n=1 Tax=Polypterus senegalus TaxID=55291 RepID=UPI0019641275|nr:butyrophilin subfamily 1 member A1-like isoform X1 [Polypterus senegalus]XP_039614980.1 butyrophilin subfamily 1 member A1-like isoform X1 [Polypterus senegalus]